MKSFQISEQFLLDGKPFKFLSGAIHYFRVHPSDWYHSLYNLKALGFNTVETYVPWNLHEFKKGEFQFEGQCDLVKFLEIAKDLNLFAIVRPAPFICSEWEFGGLPAWLLEANNMKIRRNDPIFLDAVAKYYEKLIPLLVPLQYDHGGNILMFQVENEYGSYGEEKAYLREIATLMRQFGITMPLFTSDGPWAATLESGSLIEDNILATGNFGSKGNQNFDMMCETFEKYGKKWPLMCMEFWDGWFNRWKEPVIRRDPEELANSVMEVVERGSINLYMFHGGTNFGFMNGCSARGRLDLHQVTSYDYDALLNEQGNPTPKFFAVQQRMKQRFPQLTYLEPLVKPSFRGTATLNQSVSLFDTLHTMGNPIVSKYPLTMEALGQNVGYVLYVTEANRYAEEERIRVIDASDYIQVYRDDELIATQYQMEIGEDIFTTIPNETYQLSVFVENMGRVNYGHKLLSDTQRKGIRTGVCSDLHFMTNWKQYCFEWTECPMIDFTRSSSHSEKETNQQKQPSFYEYIVHMDEPMDTYLDMSQFYKGIVFVNGVNIGRYWQVGPIQTLYAPHGMFRSGDNRIVVFDLQSYGQKHLRLVEQPIVNEYQQKN